MRCDSSKRSLFLRFKWSSIVPYFLSSFYPYMSTIVWCTVVLFLRRVIIKLYGLAQALPPLTLTGACALVWLLCVCLGCAISAVLSRL